MNDFFSFVTNNDDDRKDHNDDLEIILEDLQIEVYFVNFLPLCKSFLFTATLYRSHIFVTITCDIIGC